MSVCDKCDAQIPHGAKFCPQIADPVTDADYRERPVSEHAVPVIQIEISRSSSSRYQDAVELAQRIPTYSSEGEDDSIVHRVELETTDVALASSVWELVGNWKSSRMTINGESVTKKHLTYGALGCYQQRQKAFRPEEYCYGEDEYRQNIWGCHQLGLPLTGWAESWMTWGTFDSDGRWTWDRERIRHELEKGLYEYRFCPVLNREEVLQTLESLPDGIQPESDPDWNYIKQWKGNRQVPIGVCPTLAKAKEISAGRHVPGWKGNTTLEHASSELETTDYDYEISVEPRSQKSGCALLIGALLSGSIAAGAFAWML